MVRYGFPKQEPQLYTALTLSKYVRPKPGSVVNSVTEYYIRLPMPDTLTDNYGMEVNGTALNFAGMANMSNLPTIGDMLPAGDGFLDSLINGVSNAPGAIMDIMKRAGNYAYSVAPGLAEKIKSTNPANILALTPGLSENQFGRAAQLQTGLVRNPHMTTIFDGVKLREFTFSWRMSPKTSAEADELATLIDEIKRYMHPEITYGGFAYEYPYLAEVEFIGAASSLSTLPRVGKSFISGMSVNNLTQGTPAFYTDGRPVTVDLTLSFNEINVKTREDFKGGIGRNVGREI